MTSARDYSPPPSLDRFRRALLGIVGLGLSCVWGVALWLPPHPQGFGTHQALGLPSCTVVQWTGERCPSCGMTTSWALLIRGQLRSSAEANVGGMLLGLVALAAVPWTLGSAWRGRWWGFVPEERIAAVVLFVILSITMIDWAVRRW